MSYTKSNEDLITARRRVAEALELGLNPSHDDVELLLKAVPGDSVTPNFVYDDGSAFSLKVERNSSGEWGFRSDSIGGRHTPAFVPEKEAVKLAKLILSAASDELVTPTFAERMALQSLIALETKPAYRRAEAAQAYAEGLESVLISVHKLVEAAQKDESTTTKDLAASVEELVRSAVKTK
jgi:hypothetical protein